MRRPYLETFLISLAVILLEVSYTRIFSFKLVYYFTYLVIGLSLLGLGAGGVFVAIFERLRRSPPLHVILGCCLAAAASVMVGYFLVALTPLNLFRMVMQGAQGQYAPAAVEALKLGVVLLALFLPFLAAGIALATIFARHTDEIGRLYFIDLIGAAFGCILIIPAISLITPPGIVYLSGACFALAGLRAASARGPGWVAAVGVLALALSAGVVAPSWLPDPIRDRVKGTGDSESIFSRWNPVFRVDVVPVPVADPPVRFLIHDGTVGSSIIGWDGDVASLGRYDTQDRSIPFRLLDEGPKVAIIGSAGGNEIMASLRLGASDVTGIELNPVTISLLKEHFTEWTGNLAFHPQVKIVNAEGRSYLKSSGEIFDLIWLVAPDSYAAMNAATSGAFVLSESYLYTREMITEVLEHLSPDGILCAQFGEIDFDTKPNRTVRYLGTARQALAALGIPDFAQHVLVAVSPGFGRLENTTIMLKKSAFLPEEVATFVEAIDNVDGGRVSFTSAQPGASQVSRVIMLSGDELERFYEDHAYKVRPISDDAPFFWNFISFGTAIFGDEGTEAVNVEEGVGERLLLVFLAFAVLFAAVFLLVPLFTLREVWRSIPWKGHASIYFASLGLGFMFIEVALIQKLTLFLGYPTYSLTVTLFSILLSSGFGSLLSERYAGNRNRAFATLLGVMVVVMVAYQFLLTPIIELGVGWPLPMRALVAVVFLAPMGLCLGAFMPLGLRSVSAVTEHGSEYVAWCWAINGFFSVMASVLSTILSMLIGFTLVMYTGLVIYLIGVNVFRRIPEPE
jgi:hypothetical protein